jgi:ATP-dependent RNA helicase DeaD
VAARRTALFKERLRKALAERDELDPYLALVEEVAEEGGFEMAEVAAAAARLARGEKLLEVTVEPTPPAPPVEDGMVRLFIDAGRRDGVRPADVVGAIASEAGMPGDEIGAIDIYDSFTFVEIPTLYRDQVLERMAGVALRHRPVRVTLARPTAAAPLRRRPPTGRGRKRPFRGVRAKR